MFPKTFAIRLCALMLVLALAACGGGGAPEVSEVDPSAPAVEATETEVIVLLPGSTTTVEATATQEVTITPPATASLEPTVSPEATVVEDEEGSTSGTSSDCGGGGVEVVQVISTGMGITGQGIMQIVVQNPTSQSVVARLAPGCVIDPPDNSQQRMMVLQTAEASVAPGETATLDPYVACIDSSADAPAEAAAYTVGELVPDAELQKLATCLDQQELPADFLADFDSVMGLQFAVWQVSDGYSMDAYMEDWLDIEGGLGGEMGDMLDAIMPMLQGMADSANVWLEACDFEPVGGK